MGTAMPSGDQEATIRHLVHSVTENIHWHGHLVEDVCHWVPDCRISSGPLTVHHQNFASGQERLVDRNKW
jgi:hypothetical protein